jgi:hypothetical protein
MTTKRAASIGIGELSSAVRKAVAAVSASQKLQLDPKLHVGPILTGIIYRPTDINQAERVAAEITSQVKTTGGAALGGATLEPGVLIAGGHVICGFIAPDIAFHE